PAMTERWPTGAPPSPPANAATAPAATPGVRGRTRPSATKKGAADLASAAPFLLSQRGLDQASALCVRRFIILSKLSQTPSAPCHDPCVAALEYSVARASKKLACSTPLSSDCSHGSGFSVTP